MSEQIISKRCCKCKEIKPVSEFSKSAARKDGLQTQCKTCKAKYQRIYCRTEKGKAADKSYKQSKKGKAMRENYNQTEKRKAYLKAYRQRPESRKAHCKHIKKYRFQYPNQIKARNAVNDAIVAGRLPHLDTLQCSCGEPAKQYHHHKGYAPEHWLDVIPVCIDCHNKLPSG